jgi:hypothetical protein
MIREPTLCLPQHTVSTFNHLPIPLSKAFPRKDGVQGGKEVDIQAIVLDKDNCFAVPHTNEIHKPYYVLRLMHYVEPHFNAIVGPLPAPATSLPRLKAPDSVQHCGD